MKTAERTRQDLTTARKRKLREAAGHRCSRCGGAFPPDWLGRHRLNVHHRRQVALGGSNDTPNLQILCRDCHRKEHQPRAVIAGWKVRVISSVKESSRFESETRCPQISGELPGAERERSRPGHEERAETMARMGGATAQQETEIKEIKERDLDWNTSTGEPHPAGMYELDLVEITPFEEDGVQRIRMTFHTEEEQENGDSWPVSCKTKPSFHPRANVAKFLSACGEEPKQIDIKRFKLSDYIRDGPKFQKVMGSIIHEPRQDGQGVYARIESFAPVKNRSQKARAQAEEAAPMPVEEEAPRAARKAAVLTDDDDE